MRTTSKNMDDRLLEYIDGTLAPADTEKLQREISDSAELKARLEELQSLSHSLRVRLEEPSKNFTQRVMEQLEKSPVRNSLSIRNGIFLLIGVMVAVGISSLLLATGIFDTTGSIDLNDLVQQSKYIKQPLPSIPFNGKLVVNIIIVLNISLAFLVLDRAILKPWFENRTRMNF